MARWSGRRLVEKTGREHGVEHPVQMSVGMSDGERLWAVRYSTEHQSRTLFVSDRGETLRKLHPDNPRLQRFTDEDRVVVSDRPATSPASGCRSRSRRHWSSSRATTSNDPSGHTGRRETESPSPRPPGR